MRKKQRQELHTGDFRIFVEEKSVIVPFHTTPLNAPPDTYAFRVSYSGRVIFNLFFFLFVFPYRPFPSPSRCIRARVLYTLAPQDVIRRDERSSRSAVFDDNTKIDRSLTRYETERSSYRSIRRSPRVFYSSTTLLWFSRVIFISPSQPLYKTIDTTMYNNWENVSMGLVGSREICRFDFVSATGWPCGPRNNTNRRGENAIGTRKVDTATVREYFLGETKRTRGGKGEPPERTRNTFAAWT